MVVSQDDGTGAEGPQPRRGGVVQPGAPTPGNGPTTTPSAAPQGRHPPPRRRDAAPAGLGRSLGQGAFPGAGAPGCTTPPLRGWEGPARSPLGVQSPWDTTEGIGQAQLLTHLVHPSHAQ